jgi:hypothetical protein
MLCWRAGVWRGVWCYIHMDIYKSAQKLRWKMNWKQINPKVTKTEIEQYCTEENWQRFRRLMLKDVPLGRKYMLLNKWLETHKNSRESTVQVSNYINALKRAGQI